MLITKKQETSLYYYLLQSALLLLNWIFLPFSTTVTLSALLLGHFNLIQVSRRKFSHGTPRILVTGIGMSKGLFVARTMYLGGCDVFGADLIKDGIFCSGRFSKAIKQYFQLYDPTTNGVDVYVSQVVNIVKSCQIDLWISCSRIETQISDAKLSKALLEQTKCKVFQFNEEIISMLDDKLNFMKKTSELNIANVEWYSLTSVDDVHDVLRRIKISAEDNKVTKYIVKSSTMDDASRLSSPIIRSDNLHQAELILRSLTYSHDRRWILQEYVESGEEYCTHALVVNGHVRAFTACPSKSVLLHYQQLSADSVVYKYFFEFTQKYAASLGNITGHLSFDFLISYQKADLGFIGVPVPIECNPRCHTATIVFHGKEVELSDCYLESLYGIKDDSILEARIKPQYGFYWVANDIVELGVYPIIRMLLGLELSSFTDEIKMVLQLLDHLWTWKDSTFLWWDPVPWFMLNHVYWPMKLAAMYFGGIKWKKINVSTGKIFKK